MTPPNVILTMLLVRIPDPREKGTIAYISTTDARRIVSPYFSLTALSGSNGLNLSYSAI